MSSSNSEDFEDLALLSVALYGTYRLYKQSKKAQQRMWVRELNLARDSEGFFALNFRRMQEIDPEHFFKITRMKPRTFQLLQAFIELQKTSMRKPISADCRLFLVLLYLSQGFPKQVLAWIFRMGYSTVNCIIYETCEKLWKILMTLYLSPPSKENWTQIAKEFYDLWNLPNCVSAIDGKHINIQCPARAGSEYFNYKGHHSIVLLAACNANYIFTSITVGAYGSQSDGGIFAESLLGSKLLHDELNLPSPKLLPNSNIPFNHYIVGDAAFPLKPYLMRPYPGRKLCPEFYFNRRLSRARRTIENAFGILVARWRILQNTLIMAPANVERVVKAAVILHNFIKLNDDAYCTKEYVDIHDENDEMIQRGLWRDDAEPLRRIAHIGSNNSSTESFRMRDTLKNYLFSNKI